MIVKRNPRNIVVVTPYLVFKYRRDWNLRKIFWEFVLTWKAFLHGVSSLPILVGLVMVRPTIRGALLAKTELKFSLDSLILAVAELSRAGIDHLEIRHPQYHIFVTDNGAVRIIDFERGKLTTRPRNLSRFVVWLLERGVDPRVVSKLLDRVGSVPTSDLAGARRAIHYYLRRSPR